MNRVKPFDLDVPYPLTQEHIQFFRANGYIKLKNVFAPDVLAYYGAEISRQVQALNTLNLPMEQRNTYQKAFLQVMNIWRHSPLVKEFVFGQRLARLATELLGTRGVRLYHDQALYKEPRGGLTPWHADQQYWPLSNANTCTAWIPLQATPLELGPLAFSARSHLVQMGRDLEISDESERKISKLLLEQKLPLDETPFDLGEVSYHYGWTFHRAGANTSMRPREVMTIIYMDMDMRLEQPKNKNQQNDWDNWCPGAKVGEVIATPLNPVLYQQTNHN
jgi:ectoine hydroxylase-related dioxygenase (phytanoyl-CoA dioxygenase family)